MKKITITTTESKKLEVIKKYSVICPNEDHTRVQVNVVIDDDNSEIYKKLCQDPDVIHWDFCDSLKKVDIISSKPVVPAESIKKISEKILVFSESKIPELKDIINLKDMNEVIWLCLRYKEIILFGSFASPEDSLEVLQKSVGQEITDHNINSNIWNGLSEGLVKMILVLMAHGPKEFEKDLRKGLLRAGTYFIGETREVTNEEFLHKIFVD